MKKRTTQNGSEIYQLLSVRSNAFLVKTNSKTILIDTSVSLNWNRLQRRIKKLNISKIDYLLLSHTHFDHAGNAAAVQQKYGAKVLVHQSESVNLKTGQNRTPIGTLPFSKMLISVFETFFTKNFGYQPCEPDMEIGGPFSFDNLGVDWQVIYTPGHSIGCLSLIVDQEIALVGDAMFGMFPKSVLTPFAEDVPQLVKTWNTLLETPCSLFIAGHGWAVTREKLSRNYIKMSQKLSVNE